MLAKLEVCNWCHVTLEGTTPLPNLQHLEVGNSSGLLLDVPLPVLMLLMLCSSCNKLYPPAA